MSYKIKQKAIFVSDNNKSDGVSELNKQFEKGYIYKSEGRLKETNEVYGGILYILEKNEDN